MQINRLESPRKTYFYERPNGSIIEAYAVEAWRLHKKFKQLGVSDGTKFFKAVQDAHRIFAETNDQEQALTCLKQGRQDEIESARGHFEAPPNPDVIEPGGPTGFRPRL